ncbi:MAG TPA: DUF501 domain-containing protein [Synergistales bacterium]|nr:DUF501 domain-containing protein [Synergistales bacterium]
MLPPVFFEPPLPGDIDVVKRQAGSRRFDASLVRGVSRRCRHGFPLVTLCDPLKKGRPFPTVFWLTCPHLSLRADELESAGEVRSLGRHIKRENPEGWRVFNLEYLLFRVFLLGPERTRNIMREDPSAWRSFAATGVGGIRAGAGISMKCLHLQAASMIGFGWHPGEDRLREILGEVECDGPSAWPCGAP